MGQFFSQIFMKIDIWRIQRIQKSNSFFQVFSSSSSFLASFFSPCLLGKQCKLNSEIVKELFHFTFFSDFHKNFHNFDMENSKMNTFSKFFHLHFRFYLDQSKMAYKLSQKFFSQIFMKSSIYCIFSNKRPGCLFKNLTFQEAFIQDGHLIERAIYLQIQSIVDIAFFFDTR